MSILTKRLESIFTNDMNHCMFTGSCDVEEYRFIAPLRRDLHQNGRFSVHQNPNGKLDIYLKQQCQRYYEEHYGTREEFRQEFRKNYL